MWVGNCYSQILRPNTYFAVHGNYNYVGEDEVSCPHRSTITTQVQVWQLVTGGWQVVQGSTHIEIFTNQPASTAVWGVSNDFKPVYKRWYCTWAWAHDGASGESNSNYSQHSTQAGTGVTGTCP